MHKDLTPQQAVQAKEYNYPYHHLFSYDHSGQNFSSFRAFNFSISYGIAVRLISQLLEDWKPNTLCDIGCGDGKLLAVLSEAYSDIQMMGFDYDEHSISWAKMFTPRINFEVRDISSSLLKPGFDFITLIEVIEHIPPRDVEDFIDYASMGLKQGGVLVITVPHKNQRIPAKHYQHFDSEQLKSCIEATGNLQVIDVYGFHKRTVSEIISKGVLQTKNMFIELPMFNKFRLKRQMSAIPVDENKAQRLIAVSKKL